MKWFVYVWWDGEHEPRLDSTWNEPMDALHRLAHLTEGVGNTATFVFLTTRE